MLFKSKKELTEDKNSLFKNKKELSEDKKRLFKDKKLLFRRKKEHTDVMHLCEGIHISYYLYVFLHTDA